MGFLNSLGFGKTAAAGGGNVPVLAQIGRAYENRSLSDPWGALDFTAAGWQEWTLGGQVSEAGVKVNEETALLFSAVYSAINVISDTLAVLPREIMLRDDINGDAPDKNHPYYGFLKTEPSPYYTWFNLMKTWVANALRWGNGYVRIYRNGVGRVVRLQLLEHGEVAPWYQKTNGVETLWYHVHGQMLPPRDVLHITCLGNDAVIGKSPIQLAKDSIGLGMAAGGTMAKFYKSGLKSKVAFSNPETLDDESFQHIKQQIRETINDDFFLLEGGTMANVLNMNPSDAETLATRIFQVEDIARFYRVPLTKLFVNKNNGVGNSITDQNIDFETDCILPWSERIEAELDRKLLINPERRTHYINLNEGYVRRMDLKSRAEYYHKRWLMGSMTSNQVRMAEKEIKMDNVLMDTPFAQSGTLPMDEKYWQGKMVDKKLKTGDGGRVTDDSPSTGSGADGDEVEG